MRRLVLVLALAAVAACVATETVGAPGITVDEPDVAATVHLSYLMTDAPAPVQLAADDTHVYWVGEGPDGGGQLRRMPINGGAPETLVLLPGRMTALALDDDAAWLLTDNQGGQIIRISKYDHALLVRASAPSGATSIAVDQNSVYVNGGGAVWRLAKSSGPLAVMTDWSASSTTNIAIDDAWVYFVDPANRQIFRVAKADGEVDIIAQAEDIRSIAADGGHVYFSAIAEPYSRLYRVANSGGEIESLTQDTRAYAGCRIAAGPGGILWGRQLIRSPGTTDVLFARASADPQPPLTVATAAGRGFFADVYTGDLYEVTWAPPP